MEKIKRTLERLAHPYYMFNLALALSFTAVKLCPGLCEFVLSSKAHECYQMVEVSIKKKGNRKYIVDKKRKRKKKKKVKGRLAHNTIMQKIIVPDLRHKDGTRILSN